MRALAHPVRLALLEALGREGPLTATQAAELLQDTPGNMSWHLQTLAKYGYVEETGEGRGRRRPWRLAATATQIESADSGPEAAAAGAALEAVIEELVFRELDGWRARKPSYPVNWRKASFFSTVQTYLTADELTQLSADILALTRAYEDRVEKRKRPGDALPVQLVAFGHPMQPTPSGN